MITWWGIRIAKARYLEWGAAVGDGAEEADKGGDEVHLLPGVVRLPFVRAGESDSKHFGLARDASVYKKRCEYRPTTNAGCLDGAKLGERPCLADGEGAVGVQFRLVNEAFPVVGP
jgi:hypothetical protein